MALADDVAGFDHVFLPCNGVRLHVAVAGPRDAPLVVLLHGFPECWVTWRHLLQPLLRAGYRVAAPDLRGYNLSEKPSGVDAYRIEAIVDDVVDLIHGLGHERAIVVGHDWGGVAAWHLAARRPDVVDKLVIVNAPHPALFLDKLKNPDQARRAYYMFLFQLPWLPERLLLRKGQRPIGNIFRYQPKRAGAYDDDDIRMMKEAAAQPGAATAILNYYRAGMRQALQRKRGAGAAPKKMLSTPTLVVWGLDDGVLLPDHLDGLERHVERLRVVRVPQCSHWVQHDAPEILARELLAFASTSTTPMAA